LACHKWFSDVTDTALAHSKVDLPRWFYLLRELDKGRPVSQIQPEIGVTYKTALRMAHIVCEALYVIFRAILVHRLSPKTGQAFSPKLDQAFSPKVVHSFSA